MAYINGGLVLGVSHKDLYELVPNKKHYKYLIQHRTPKHIYLVDRLISYNPELKDMLDYIRDNVSRDSWYKSIKGYVSGYMLRVFMYYQLNSQQYAYRVDLMLYSSYAFLQKYFQRLVKILIEVYNYRDRKINCVNPPLIH